MAATGATHGVQVGHAIGGGLNQGGMMGQAMMG